MGDLFQERNVREILATPLSQRPLNDEIIWHFSPKSDYTVKSAYRLVMDKILNVAQLHVSGNWN